jgi:hypothetical protein
MPLWQMGFDYYSPSPRDLDQSVSELQARLKQWRREDTPQAKTPQRRSYGVSASSQAAGIAGLAGHSDGPLPFP